MTLQQGGPNIVLPDNPEWIEKLRREREHAKAERSKGKFRAPETMVYELAIEKLVDHLLEKKSANTWNVSRELAALFGGSLNASQFGAACQVIEDICKTGGKNPISTQ